jgi:hypothetical protein
MNLLILFLLKFFCFFFLRKEAGFEAAPQGFDFRLQQIRDAAGFQARPKENCFVATALRRV